MTENHSATGSGNGNPLQALRSVRSAARQLPQPLNTALEIAEHQARALFSVLTDTLEHERIIHRVANVLPIDVSFIENLPNAAVSFWSRHRWNIHIRSGDPAGVQDFAFLHEVKHILDHPLRQQHPRMFTGDEWEQIANHFAVHALTLQTATATP